MKLTLWFHRLPLPPSLSAPLYPLPTLLPLPKMADDSQHDQDFVGGSAGASNTFPIQVSRTAELKGAGRWTPPRVPYGRRRIRELAPEANRLLETETDRVLVCLSCVAVYVFVLM